MKAIAQVWIFASSSGRGTYETLQYVDATTSCNCPGWTRRTAPDGSRSCKHTRMVDLSRADGESESHHDYRNPSPSPSFTVHSPVTPMKKPAPAFGGHSRKLSL